MANVGPNVPAMLGMARNLPRLPPPGSGLPVSETGVFKKLKRGIKKGVKKAGRGLKKAGKVAVKIHTAPIRLAAKAGKFVLLKAAQLAATPIRVMFKKLAMRRAKLLSWKSRRSMSPNAGEKTQAAAWALARLNSKGPLGKFGVKILRFTKGATLGAQLRNTMATLGGGTRKDPVSDVGLTGAEIAAAAGAIAGAIAAIMKSLNKPGEAPADPRAEEAAEEAAPAAEAVEEANEEASTEGWPLEVVGDSLAVLGEDDPLTDGNRGKLKKAYRRLKAAAESPTPTLPPPGSKLKPRYGKTKKAYRNRCDD